MVRASQTKCHQTAHLTLRCSGLPRASHGSGKRLVVSGVGPALESLTVTACLWHHLPTYALGALTALPPRGRW